MADWESPDGEVFLRNVHRETGRCVLGNCAIHNPDPTSRMNIEKWTYTWMNGMLWRLCKCGKAHWHPDVDDEKYHLAHSTEDEAVRRLRHMCCGCCDSKHGLDFDELYG